VVDGFFVWKIAERSKLLWPFSYADTWSNVVGENMFFVTAPAKSRKR
jgi:hypothetical protein